MGAMQRSKGQRGEREVSRLIYELTGWEVRRRVRQHDGDADLEGVPGWSVEVKDHATAKLGDVRGWWAQAVEQACKVNQRPLLVYKRQRGEWRAVWPISASGDAGWLYDYTAEGSVEAWAYVAREMVV